VNHASTQNGFQSADNSENEFKQIIDEHLRSQDDREFGLGDTLDIKTSIALVVVIFLATQSGGFLASPMPLHWHNIQIVSVGCVIIAGVLAMIVLWPRTYKLKIQPSEFLGWTKQVNEFYGENRVAAVEFIRSKQIQRIQKRFAVNSSINASKSAAMSWSFYFTMTALILNIATLIGLSTGWRF